MAATASEVRAHLGVGFDTFCRAHLGRLCDVNAIVVAPEAARQPGRQQGVGLNAFDGIVIQIPVEKLDKTRLKELAQEAAELAELPEVRTWASSVFSRAGRQGTKLDTQTALAETLLADAKRSTFFARNYGPLTRTMHFAAGMVATGVHVTLVAHGDREVLTRLLSAVYVDGEWRYADPAQQKLGAVRAFGVEETETVPHLETPEEVAQQAVAAQELAAYAAKLRVYEQEVTEYKARVAAIEAQAVELAAQQAAQTAHAQAVVQQAQAELQLLTNELAPPDATPEQRAGLTVGQKVLIVGAVTAAVYMAWRLAQTSRRVGELERTVQQLQKPRKPRRRRALKR